MDPITLTELVRDIEPPSSERFPPRIVEDYATVMSHSGVRERAKFSCPDVQHKPLNISICAPTIPLVLVPGATMAKNGIKDIYKDYRTLNLSEFFYEKVVLHEEGYANAKNGDNLEHMLFGKLRNPLGIIA